jgi:hypothetical protein
MWLSATIGEIAPLPVHLAPSPNPLFPATLQSDPNQWHLQHSISPLLKWMSLEISISEGFDSKSICPSKKCFKTPCVSLTLMQHQWQLALLEHGFCLPLPNCCS